MSNKFSRKDFLKLSGLAAAAIPASTVVGKMGDYELVESPKKYGGFLIKRLAKESTPFEIDESTFERFDQFNTMFGRSRWDPTYQAMLDAAPKGVAQKKLEDGVPGWNVFESEFRESAWWLARNRGADSYGWETEPSETAPKLDDYTSEEITGYIKTAALFFGASMVGVAETDERWFYKSIGRTPDDPYAPLTFEDVDVPIINEDGSKIIPKKMNRVIVMAHEMDYEAFLPNGINKIAGAAAGQGYSKMAFHTATLANYIRRLGYQAIPMGNDSGLSVPMAIAAGLGEQGRLGFLITPKYGPRVRLSKILTDMPLDVDTPISFGALEFCENCRLCAEYCPSGCIDTVGEFDKPTFATYDINNIVGVKKWQVDQKKCHVYWSESGVGCSNCIAACPFNKPESWMHEATRILIGAKSGPIDALMANLDHASGYGGLLEEPDADAVKAFWEKKNFIHIDEI